MNQRQPLPLGRRKTLLTTLAVLIPVLAAGIFIGLHLHLEGADTPRPEAQPASSPAAPGRYAQALAAYQEARYADAAAALDGALEEVLGEPEGCELLISVYAEAKDMAKLEEASRRCLATAQGEDIAAEGLAFSLSAQGRYEESVEALTAALAKRPSQRTQVALARVHVMLGHDKEAAKLFADVVGSSEIWSVWLSQALRYRVLSQNPDFIKELVELVLAKPTVLASVERRLLAEVEALHLEDAGERLRARLAPVEEHDPA